MPNAPCKRYLGGLCIALTSIALSVVLGCASNGPSDEDGPAIPRGATPEYGLVAARYNQRLNRLEQVQGNVSLVIKATNGKGKKINEQVEGNLKVALPRRLALRIDKVGETIFYLGSNDESYWWIDLTDENAAVVGRHDKATPESAMALGVPVHPLDLIELLGIVPLRTDRPEEGATTLAWSQNGHHLHATTLMRWGSRRLWINPETYVPTRVDLLDADGRVSVTSRLSRYETVTVEGNAMVKPRIASRFDIEIPGNGTTLVMSLVDPENPGDKMRPKPFDLAALLHAYNVKTVHDIDAPVVGAGAPGNGGK